MKVVMKLLISIIIPIYNVEKYAKKCIESVINQTYSNLQIILVNDGSVDKSGEICNYYASIDNRVTVIHKDNGGLSSARNIGIEAALGEYIMFLDGDDYISIYAVEELTNILNEHLVDIIQFRYIETNSNELNYDSDEKHEYHICTNTREMFDNLYEIGGEYISACTKIYNKKIFENLRFKNGILYEDQQIISNILTIIDSIAYYNKQLYYYLIRPNSIITSKFNRKKLDIIDIIEERIEFLKTRNYNDLVDREIAKHFNNLIILYCESKCSGCIVENKIILDKLREYIKLYGNNRHIAGKNKLLLIALRLDIRFIHIYYMLKYINNKRKVK